MPRNNKHFKMNFDLDKISEKLEEKLKKAIIKEQQKNAREFRRETARWNKPLEITVNEDDDNVTIETDDERFKWVDEGTAPHQIRPRNARILRFLPGNRVRSEIARRQNNAARKDASVVFAKQISHPGIKPRSITQKVLARRRLPIISEISKVVEKAIQS
jgi:hypothetical protein